MDDTGCRGGLLAPVAPSPRQYEALRACCIAGRRLHDIAPQFGSRETSWRAMVCRFRAPGPAGAGPPFVGHRPGGAPGGGLTLPKQPSQRRQSSLLRAR